MRHSMIEAMRDRLLSGLDAAKRQGASAAKILFDQREELGCSFENGRLKAAGASQTAAYRVEAIVDGKAGSASGNRPEEVEEIVERAVALARLGSVAHFDAYPGPAPTADVLTWSERTAGLEREKLIDGCGEIVEALRGIDPELYIGAGAERAEGETLLVTTGGVAHASRSTYWSLGAYVQRTVDTDMLFASEGRAWKDLNAFWDPAWIAGEIAADLRAAERPAPAPTGQVTALLTPQIFGMMLMGLKAGVSGRAVAKGDSPLAGRLGEEILDPAITLRDNPHEAYCPGATAIDDDGVPTRPIEIVTAGVLKNFLYDLDSAGLAGAQPTGHDGCAPHCPEVLPGQVPSRELLAGIEDGLLVKSLIGFGQSNLMNGDFSGNVALGYRVRNGELVGRVKNVMIAGNLYELLRENVTLSSDRDENRRAPWCRVEGLSVSAAQPA